MITPTPPAVDDVCAAYDGSVNAHWMVRYAIRFAAATASRRLRLLHVEDHALSATLLRRKLEHVLSDCVRAGVEAEVQSVHASVPVSRALLDAAPRGPAAVLLCAARARPHGGPPDAGFLARSVTLDLLSRAPCDVLALRIVSPGLLGAPRRLLLPVAGNPGEGRTAARFLAPFVDTLDELHLLRVVLADEHTARHAPPPRMAALRAYGRAAVTYVERELRGVLETGDVLLDAHVRIAESWARPALVLAGQQRCGLVLAGASPAALARSDAELERLLAGAPCDVGLYRGAS